MLLFRGTDWDKGLSPEQVQQIVADWYVWFNGLIQDGRAIDGKPLMEKGKLVTGKNGQVADGPFAESKEAIAGYFYLQVADEAEAIEIARKCPALKYGCQVEVRPVADTCQVRARSFQQQEAQPQLAAVGA